MAETEQNKTEEATPFKLKRAREKGSVARGADLGYFASLAALSLSCLAAGAATFALLLGTMRRTFSLAPEVARDPHTIPNVLAQTLDPAVDILFSLGSAVFCVVVLCEIIQVRGLIFTTSALKPDFSRLNPGKGLKRVFSVRTLKETAKNVAKLALYTIGSFLIIRHAAEQAATSASDDTKLISAITAAAWSLLSFFLLVALLFALIDQVLSRREFSKQMRMSRSELTREVKDREGEPRIKRKRRQLHAQFAQKTRALGDLTGSDMLVVNPDHYAVGLVYDADTMSAPRVTAKGKNHFAMLLKNRARDLSIVIYEAPPLARALYRSCDKGQEIPSSEFALVVELYIKHNHLRTPKGTS